ncbi:MAG TPA: hypothetical protein VFM41_12515, partial [Gaiella sp.]|nr:hypothetical protein [Gaiella sp.]
ITAEMTVWTKPDNYEFVFEENPEDRDDVAIRVRVNDYPPAYLGTILGDFLNNARAALDYITTRLDLEAGGRGDNIYFFIYTERGAFNDHASRKLSHLDPSHVALIESLQPFNGTRRPYTQHPAVALRELARIDKHRAVTPTLFAPLSFQLLWFFDDKPSTQVVKAKMRGEIKDGTEIARIRWPTWPPGSPRPRKVEVRTKIEMQLMFGRWELPDATWAVLSWVRDDVLARFAPILRRLG